MSKRGFVLAGCLLAAVALLLVFRGILPIRPKAPPLTSVYADLTAFWAQAAASLQIEPETGRLQQWNLGYDRNGAVLYQSFKLYVDRGAGTYDVYYYSQDQHDYHGAASWSRQRLRGSVPTESVPAHLAFAAVNQVGFRELERRQNLELPARFWFFGESGSKTYRPVAGGYVVRGGQILPIPPEGVTVNGAHGTFGIAAGAVNTSGTPATTATLENPGPPLFVVPLSED